MNFKKFLEKRRRLILVGVTNPIETLIAEAEGFRAGYVSGAALSARLGLLDEGLIALDKMVEVVRDIRKVSNLPLLVDCDTGLLPENSEDFQKKESPEALKEMAHPMMHLLWDAGADAIQIEDQVHAKKRCGHLPGKELVSLEEMFWKIRMLSHFRKSEDQIIVARTDARAVEGLDGAIFRAHRYINAGADAIFPEALESLEEFKEFRRQIPRVPLVANLAEHGKTPPLTTHQLFSAGYQVVLIPATAFRMELETFRNALKEIKLLGSLNLAVENNELISRKELNELIRKRSKIYETKKPRG